MTMSRRRLVRLGLPVLTVALSGAVGACDGGARPEAAATTAMTAGQRVPPGQRLVDRLLVLDLGIRPDIDLSEWSLTVSGQVANPVTLTWTQFQALPHVERIWDFHCVTGWSKLDTHWAGVLLSEVVALVQPKETVTSVIFTCRDGYSTNVSYAEVLAKESMLVDQLDGVALPLEHGGPVRGLVPWLYAWKSAKFVSSISFEENDRPGYWETRGYHNHADPWKEERFG